LRQKHYEKFILFVWFTLVALPTIVSANEIDLRINGIGLGTSQSTVFRQLGKPLEIKKGEYDECGGDIRKILRYSGLTIELLGDGNGRNFTVTSIEVSSSKWLVASKIRVSVSPKSVQAKFGLPYNKGKEEGLQFYSYINKGNDGFADFYFRGNKIVKISWEYNPC